ncbi:hypothetical protein ACTIVE_7944 [Actinomadura verrucosospora]|uniref:Uncharacterized protein n=2 Tax=Actinomadura verrucosospora TaxID=46165 RepID=A0A7D3W582_ACTVE|nr:hypothetical protein ACTIVE_7944 [Actinomadura verrucosospora]
MADTLGKRQKFFSDLAPGDCVKLWDGGGNEEIVDCDEKHQVQIYAIIKHHNAAYPTEKEMMYGCSERAVQVFGTHPPDALERWTRPRDDIWMMGQRFVFCLAAARHGSLKHSVMPE